MRAVGVETTMVSLLLAIPILTGHAVPLLLFVALSGGPILTGM